MVEHSYRNYLDVECNNQKSFKRKLQRMAEQKGLTDGEMQQRTKKANEFELSRCNELADLFPDEKRKR